MTQIMTGSPNVNYGADGTVAHVVSGALSTSQRVQEYNFGYIATTGAGSVLFGSTQYPINGEISSLAYAAANFTTGGSIWLQTIRNGIYENIGSVAGALNTNSVVYPAKALQNGTGAVRVPVNGYVFYSGIGVGGPTSGQLVFTYR